MRTLQGSRSTRLLCLLQGWWSVGRQSCCFKGTSQETRQRVEDLPCTHTSRLHTSTLHICTIPATHMNRKTCKVSAMQQQQQQEKQQQQQQQQQEKQQE